MNKTKKIMLFINILIMIILFYHNFIYQSTGYHKELKVTCSCMFVAQGLINFIYAILTKQSNVKFYSIMTVGLFLACLGDYLILFDFIKGAISFALGHIAFIIAYCFLHKIRKLDLFISGGLFIACLIFLLSCSNQVDVESAIKIVCIIYAIMISTMVGKSIGNYINQSNYFTLTAAIGSTLFFASDIMLVLAWFIKEWDWASNVCLAIYYPALALIAFSMLLKTVNKTTNDK